MVRYHILLVTTDPALVEEMRGACLPSSTLSVFAVSGAFGAWDQLEGDSRLGAVVVHLAEGNDSAGVARVLRTVAATGRRVPVVVLSDCSRVDQAVEMIAL